jgi:hypothetical protein
MVGLDSNALAEHGIVLVQKLTSRQLDLDDAGGSDRDGLIESIVTRRRSARSLAPEYENEPSAAGGTSLFE